MKTYRFYIMTLALTFLFAGCSEDELTKGPGAQVGDEVQFGLSLSKLDTRTVYGDETSTGFPIYWVNGDKVRVASPQCLSGRNSAEYQIAVASTTQNYATSMTKTGDAGVQWGDADKADFYSIYPSSASTSLEVSGEGVTTTLHVDATQFASTTDNGTSYYAQPAEMGNVVMYAKTSGVESGKTVELHYTPFSTVLEFEINASTEEAAGKQTTITIQSLTLTAPTGTTIAGDFGFTFPSGESTTPTIEAATGGSNSITLHFLENDTYTTVLSISKTTLKAKMCLMPISGVSTLKDWKVEVNTSAGTFSKTIKDSDLTDKNTALAPGKVHKIKLPTLNYSSKEWVYSLKNWITSLPDYKNIYLSEISLPGAWYAGSKEAYQATTDIPTLWNAGVRAFAVETRTTSTGYTRLGVPYEQTEPSGVVLSGTQNNSDIKHSAGTNSLGTGSSSRATVCWSGTSISTIITNIANEVKADEYGVLVLSYADGGTSGHRAVDYGAWLQLLYDAYNGLGDAVKAKIYQNGITANTTVNDVLGKLILKINVDANIAMTGSVSDTNYAYSNNLPALFSYNPFLFQMTDADKTRPYYSDLSWSTWGDGNTYRNYNLVANLTGISNEEAANKFLWVFSSANRTQLDSGTDGTIPHYSDRKDALGAMMTFSRTVYEKSHHNVWFYFNCGGTEASSQTSDSPKPSPTSFATEMNPWLLDQINSKTDASPLGIVMFNQCTSDTYSGPAIVKAIVEMNSKFYLKHAGANTDNTGGNTEQTAAVTSAAPGFDSGMEDSGEYAIHW